MNHTPGPWALSDEDGPLLMRARHLPRLARIEARTWYESGKYLGSAAPWRIADRAALEAEMTGDFFGDWAGTRRRDGAAIVAREITRALEAHASPLWDNRMGEVTHSPLPRGDWGEWRIVTEAALRGNDGQEP